MSGQPTNKPLDAEKFRKAYLKTLSLQESINQKNLNANRLYIKTGTPQQPPDTRSVEEKFADQERIKVDLRSSLLKLMDGTNAEKVVQNASPAQFYYMSQGIDFLIQSLKPKNKYGMLAETFLMEVDRYIKSMGANPFESNQILLKDDIRRVRLQLEGLDTISRDLWRSLSQTMKRMEANAVSRDDLEAIASMIDPLLKAQAEAQLREKVADQPARDQFYGEAEGILARDEAGDIRGAEEGAMRLIELADGAVEALDGPPLDSGSAAASAEVVVMSGYKPLAVVEKLSGAAIKSYYEKLQSIAGAGKLLSKLGTTNKAEWGSYAESGRAKAPAQKTLIAFFRKYDEQIKDMLRGAYVGDIPARSSGRPIAIDTPVATPVAESLGGNPEGMGIRRKPRMGSGIIKKKNHNVLQDSDIDWKAGVSIPKVARYIPFGRFVINKRLLGEGIVSIKNPCGSCLNDIRSERVSPNIANAVRVILGGGSPTYDDISNMTDVERSYLHHITSRADLGDRLNIPAPDKKKNEQDINQFEIMRGQIMAGNDSSKLHKDFKLLIMKMMKKKLLPKRQANELLFEMASLGY
jgi:hypothetical protein